MAAGEALNRENADGLCRWLWQHGEVEKAELLQAAVDAEERVAEIVRTFEEEKKTLQRDISRSFKGEIKALREQVAHQEKLLQDKSTLPVTPVSQSFGPPGTPLSGISTIPSEHVQEETLALRATVEEQSNQILVLLKKVYEEQDALSMKLLLQRATDAEAKTALLEANKITLEAKLEEFSKSIDDDREQVRRHFSDVFEKKQQQLNDMHLSQVGVQADRIVRLQSDLEQKEQFIAQCRQEVAQKDAQFARLQADTAETREGQQILLQRVMERTQDAEAKAAEYYAELEDARAELRNLMTLPSTTPGSAEDASPRRRLGELLRALEEKDRYIAELQEQARVTEARIPELLAEAAGSRVQALESSCLQQETLIAQLEGTITAKEACITQMRAAVADQEKQLMQTQAILSERDQQSVQLRTARSNAEQECARLKTEITDRDRKVAELQESRAAAEKKVVELQVRAEAEQAARRSCMGQTLEADRRVAQIEVVASRAEAAEHDMRVRAESAEANIAQLAKAHLDELEALRSTLSRQFEEEITALRERARLAEAEIHRSVDGNLNARSEMDKFDAERETLKQAVRRAEEEARRCSQDRKMEIEGLETTARQAVIDEARRVDELNVALSEHSKELQAEECVVQNLRAELAAADANAQTSSATIEEHRVRDLEEERELLREQMAHQRGIFEGVLQDLHQKMRQSEDALLALTVATANGTRDAAVQLSKDSGTLQQHLSEMRQAILTMNGNGPSFLQPQQPQSPLIPIQRVLSQIGGTVQSPHGSAAIPGASPQVPPLPRPSTSCGAMGSRNASFASNQEAGSPLCGAVSPVSEPIPLRALPLAPHAFRTLPAVGPNGNLMPGRHTAYGYPSEIVRASTPTSLSPTISPRPDVELL